MFQIFRAVNQLQSRCAVWLYVAAASMAVCLLTPMTPVAAQQDNGDPTQDELFVFRPNSPVRQVRGAVLAERLDRPGLAQGYLQDLIDSQPTIDTLRALRREFGIALFLKLSVIKELQPTSRDLLKLMNDSVRQEIPTADAVESLIAVLGQSEQQTLEASVRILSAEGNAVEPLLAADPTSRQGEIAAQILQKYARRFRHGLLTALKSADESGRTRILELLATTVDPEIAYDLTPYRFDESTMVSVAATKATERLLRGRPLPGSADAAVDVLVSEAMRFITDAGAPFPSRDQLFTQRNLRNRQVTTEDRVFGAYMLERAATLGRHATSIRPDNETAMAAQLVAEITEQSWPAVWPEQIDIAVVDKATDPAAMDIAALQMALQTENRASVFGVLSRPETAAVLNRHPKLLRSCLLFPSSRVRLMTAGIAHAHQMTSPYAAAVIASGVEDSEMPEAVAIDSRSGDSATTAAVLVASGYSAKAANSGQSGFEAATRQLHCELILVHSNCLRWSLSETIANLRADYRTRNTPIIIYGPERDRRRTERLRSSYRGLWWITEPISEITFVDTLRFEHVPPPILSEAERRSMAQFARSLR
jgi:CheY-like chemotaxis protein